MGCSVGVVGIDIVADIQHSGSPCIVYDIQALFQHNSTLCCSSIYSAVCISIDNAQCCTLFYFALNHYIKSAGCRHIYTCRVIVVGVGVYSKPRCNVTGDTVRFIHLHTEFLGIFCIPIKVVRLFCCIGIILCPSITIHLIYHSLQAGWECLIFTGCLCRIERTKFRGNTSPCTIIKQRIKCSRIRCNLCNCRCHFKEFSYLLCCIIDLGYCPMRTGVVIVIKPAHHIIATIITIIIIVHMTVIIGTISLQSIQSGI